MPRHTMRHPEFTLRELDAIMVAVGYHFDQDHDAIQTGDPGWLEDVIGEEYRADLESVMAKLEAVAKDG